MIYNYVMVETVNRSSELFWFKTKQDAFDSMKERFDAVAKESTDHSDLENRLNIKTIDFIGSAFVNTPQYDYDWKIFRVPKNRHEQTTNGPYVSLIKRGNYGN